MSIDLDAIEALTSDPYQYAQTSPLVTRGYLTALLTELRATTADLAVAVEVARERKERIHTQMQVIGEQEDQIIALIERWRERVDDRQRVAAESDDPNAHDGFITGVTVCTSELERAIGGGRG